METGARHPDPPHRGLVDGNEDREPLDVQVRVTLPFLDLPSNIMLRRCAGTFEICG